MSKQRCLLSEHPQKMYVTLLSVFRRVKTGLSFRKSRVSSRTRFQSLIGGWWRYTPRCFLRMSLCPIVLGME